MVTGDRRPPLCLILAASPACPGVGPLRLGAADGGVHVQVSKTYKLKHLVKIEALPGDAAALSFFLVGCPSRGPLPG